ncbi:MAG: 3',5'-cyclic-AMP phosphodiesterase [Saccharospirillum sp.]
MKQPILHLVQITDSHLHASTEGTLLGMKTQLGLDMVLERVEAERPQIDLVLATGDIAQDGSVEAYQRFLNDMGRLQAPVRWTPGNHDNPDHMQQALVGRESTARPVFTTDQWVVILLDSTVRKKVHGHLAEDQLALLDRLLTQHADKHALVTLHHHPRPMGCTWIDKIGVNNADAFNAVIQRHKNVRLVLWGHVHQHSDTTVDGIRYISTPSTCVQFAPHTRDFAIDEAGPGYRWLELGADGSIETGLTRIEGIDFEIDYSVKGY